MESTYFIERRQLERIERAVPIRFSIASENHGVEHDAITVDWSSFGLRIGTAVPLSQGEEVLVLSHGDSQAAIPARVTWVGVTATGTTDMAGLELLYSLPL